VRVLGLIPAKGGSQRLARKNVLPLGGRPLIQWAIEAATKSGVFDKLLVSTEDREIAEMAISFGAQVPFMRTNDLARDPAGVVDVALHVIERLRQLGELFDVLIVMLPTCPFRSASDIQEALRLFRKNDARFLMSVTRSDHNPYNAMNLEEGGWLNPCFPDLIGSKPGRFPPAFRANGAIHVLDIPAFEASRSYYTQPLLAYVMPPERSVDIDSAIDLKMAEALLLEIKND